MTSQLEIGIWVIAAGMCYSLRESEMWLNINSPNWMKTEWFLNETNRHPWWTFQWFKDSYHFFGNFIRVALVVRLSFVYDVQTALIFFCAWAVGRYFMYWYIKQ